MIETIAAGYGTIGLVVAMIGPAAASIDDEHQKFRTEYPVKAQVYRAVLIIAMMAFWPVLFPSAVLARAKERQRKSSSLFSLLEALTKDGTDEDTIPGATGEFGLTTTNPIPTHTPLGSAAYLRALRSLSGGHVLWSRRGSTSSNGGGRPIDIYDLSDGSGGPLATLFISPYHKRNSRRAPKGFQLVDAPSQSNPIVGHPPDDRPDERPSAGVPETSPAATEQSSQKVTAPGVVSPALSVAKQYLARALTTLAGEQASLQDRQAAEGDLCLANDLGLAVAPFFLASAHWSGAFGTQDKREARKWAEIGARNGDSGAGALLRTIERELLAGAKAQATEPPPPPFEGIAVNRPRPSTAPPETSTAEPRAPARPRPPRTRTDRAVTRLVPEDKLDFLLLAMGSRAGWRCREDARETLAKSRTSDPSFPDHEAALSDTALRLATRRGLLIRDSDAGMRGKVDGADALFEERRAIFIGGVEQGLASDDDE